ncbi:AAA family ATPase [Armatimonas sp.]|uniref:AAA family ATPase n=1 Tax=Armatimonas sp. TaxID=1872638 RepID=UPI0037503D6C
MITRLQVDGFKNLVDVDIHFGKFNVITGANGVGKSNVFDALGFIKSTTTLSLRESFSKIRGAENNWKNASHNASQPINITIDTDHQYYMDPDRPESKREIKYFYNLQITTVSERPELSSESIRYSQDTSQSTQIIEDEIINEFKKQTRQDSFTDLYIIHNSFKFHDSVSHLYSILKRISIINLDLSKINQDDNLNTSPYISESGQHVPSTIERLCKTLPSKQNASSEWVLTQLSNRLFELTGEIKEIQVQRHDPTEKIWIKVKDPDGTWHNARTLSDGTLRFLALTVLWLDPEATGVFCIEEPENGIHPSKIPALMRLLRDISKKPGCQVIVNTHSPLLVAQAPADDVVVASSVSSMDRQGNEFTKVKFSGLKGTWRAGKMPIIPISALSSFLDIARDRADNEKYDRVVDRPDTQRLLHKMWELEEES